MADCAKCKTKADFCCYCDDGSEFEPQTNADHIRSMSDEELAEWLTKITDDAQTDARTKCDYQWGDWLKSEAKE
jgi:hypothetical protein